MGIMSLYVKHVICIVPQMFAISIVLMEIYVGHLSMGPGKHGLVIAREPCIRCKWLGNGL